MKNKFIVLMFVILLALIFSLPFVAFAQENEPVSEPVVNIIITPHEKVELKENFVNDEECETSESTESIEIFKERWHESAVYLAKTVWGEARGTSIEGQEKVIWCILNRVDHSDFPDTIIGVVTAPGAFHGYSSHHPCTEEMYELSLSVIKKWQAEKEGEEVDRILGCDYLYFCADGNGGNAFRTEW